MIEKEFVKKVEEVFTAISEEIRKELEMCDEDPLYFFAQDVLGGDRESAEVLQNLPYTMLSFFTRFPEFRKKVKKQIAGGQGTYQVDVLDGPKVVNYIKQNMPNTWALMQKRAETGEKGRDIRKVTDKLRKSLEQSTKILNVEREEDLPVDVVLGLMESIIQEVLEPKKE